MIVPEKNLGNFFTTPAYRTCIVDRAGEKNGIAGIGTVIL
jgi:hypothetical protein